MLYGMEYHVEMGVPVPEPENAKTKGTYPWDEMSVGSSFIARCKDMQVRDTIKRLYMACRYRMSKHGGRYVVRAVPGGVRVWRVK